MAAGNLQRQAMRALGCLSGALVKHLSGGALQQPESSGTELASWREATTAVYIPLNYPNGRHMIDESRHPVSRHS